MSWIIAFLAGLISFASPCVLPLIPSYLGFLAGSKGEKRNFHRTLAFVLGFGTVFVILGILFAAGGLASGGALPGLRVLAGILIVVLAANMIFDFLPFLNFEKRVHASRPLSWTGAFVVGTAFGAGWTPCIGPYLAGILFLAGSGSGSWEGGFLLALYSLGLGLPFLVLSLAYDRFTPWLSWMKRHLTAIKRGGAGLMLLMGVLMIFGQMTVIPRFFVRSGTQLEAWATDQVFAATYLGAGLLAALCLLTALVIWRAFRKGRLTLGLVVLIPGAGFLVLLVFQLGGRLNLVGLIGSWMQFQGI